MSFAKSKQEVALRAKAFGMSIIYNNRNRLPCEKEVGATYVSLADLIATSDVISLNLGLTESNRHMIGAPEFAKMKDGVVIVNTARGALVDEGAMLAALKSGKVSSILVIAFLTCLW
jgi:glyoxylate reductase